MPEPTVGWSEGWVWLGGSLFLIVLAANVSWFFRRPRSGAIGEFVAGLVSWRFSPWLLQVMRLLAYIGVPFAALLWGHDAVTRGLLALQPFELAGPSWRAAGGSLANDWLDWARDTGWAVALGMGVFVLLATGWWAYRRALITAGIGGATTEIETSGWVVLREAVYHEVHWAFYRNAPILTLDGYLGFTLGKYWGVWVGLALVALEALLNPAWRHGLTDAERAPAQLMRAALAIVSSILFLQSGNLWLALALHFGVSVGMSAFARALPLPTLEREQLHA